MILQTLRKSPLYLIVGTVLIFASCQEEVNTTVQEAPVAKEAIRAAPSLQLEEKKEETAQSPVIIDNENSSNAEAVRLNPPHGQPGHDCAVAVGAPLPSSSAAASTSAPVRTPVAAPVVNTPQVAPVVNPSGGVKLNPPHGQPGHDCAVPVGQPLN